MRRVQLVFRGDEGAVELSVELDGKRCRLRRGDGTGQAPVEQAQAEQADVERLPDGRVSLLFSDGRQLCGRILQRERGEVELVRRGVGKRISLAEPLFDRLAHAGAQAAGEDQEEEIRALMPGRVVEIAVAPGHRVAAGALLLVLEAMKMQNEIRTSRGGIVARVGVEAGAAVEGGALLAVVRAEGSQAPGIQ